MANSQQVIIECPFYFEHTKTTISCEGLCGTGMTNHTFNSKDELNKQLASVCSYLGGKMCPHYRAVSLLYERGLRH